MMLMNSAPRRLTLLRALADADDHADRHTGAVLDRLGIPTTEAAWTAAMREIYALDHEGLAASDLCGCDCGAVAHKLTDRGVAALTAASAARHGRLDSGVL